MPLGGGAARQMLKDVDEADWSPDGSGLAVVRQVEGLSRLEFPVGAKLFETAGWISHPRISPDGRMIGFIHHEYQGNDAGNVMAVSRDGKLSTLSEGWGTIRGLAWSADGSEVWFTGHEEGAGRNLHAVSLDGQLRVLHRVPGQLCIQDVFSDGRALMTHSMERQAIMVQAPGDDHERDLSWLDWSLLRDISADGEWVLLNESGEGGGPNSLICIRPTDGSPAIQLGEGFPQQFSPDGAWVLAIQVAGGRSGPLQLLPTGVGESQLVDTHGLRCYSARWLPDGRSLILACNSGDGPIFLYRLDLPDGKPVRLGPDVAVSPNFEVSPDGRWIAARPGDQPPVLYPIAGGEPRAIPGVRPGEELQPWTGDSSSVLVQEAGSVPARIHRIEIDSGARSLFREVIPPDPSGVGSMRGFRFTPDGRGYGYTYTVQLDDLYMVENLR